MTMFARQNAASGMINSNGSVTSAQVAHMMNVISHLKMDDTLRYFRGPIGQVGESMSNYPSMTKRRMDLSTMDIKLKHGLYISIDEFARDLELMVTNAVAFCEAQHVVAKGAKKLQSLFNEEMSRLPNATAAGESSNKPQPLKKAGKQTNTTKKQSEESEASQSKTGSPPTKEQMFHKQIAPQPESSNLKNTTMVRSQDDLDEFADLLTAGLPVSLVNFDIKLQALARMYKDMRGQLKEVRATLDKFGKTEGAHDTRG